MHVNRRGRLSDKGVQMKGRKHKKKNKFCKKENWRKVDAKANTKFYNEANKREKQGNK